MKGESDADIDDYELILAELKAEKKYKIAKFNREMADLDEQIQQYKDEIANIKAYG